MRYKSDRHALPPFSENGMLLVDKPAEWTSFDVVNKLRWYFNIPKIGHCGTLDPRATGLLVLMLGKYTKLAQEYTGHDKTYIAEILLGTETDSYDLDGTVTAEKSTEHLTESMVNEAIEKFRGEIFQVPPMTSALKKDGKKLCDLARKGIEVEREARPVTVHEFKIIEMNLPMVKAEISCSKGTYIRSIAHDLGEVLGVGGTLASLRRTRCGELSLDDALTLEDYLKMTQEDLIPKLQKDPNASF